MPEERLSLPRVYTQKILRAIREFELIDSGDRILVGFSGGKDSAFLLYALAILSKHQVIPFEVAALTIEPGFEQPLERERLQKYCDWLEIPFLMHQTEIARYALSEENSESPCATCAFLRRGTMNRIAREQGYNKVALAHHYDDAVETFLMSIIYSGQIKTFLPRTELERSGVVAIRPLVYLREIEIQAAQSLLQFEPQPSPCPLDKKTKRAEIKALIREFCQQDQRVFRNLASAMCAGRPQELWNSPLIISKNECKLKNN